MVEEDPSLEMVMEYIALLSDRIEIVAQATVYNTHEHQRFLVATGYTTQEQASKTVTGLARDLDVPVTLIDGEDMSFES